VLHTTTGAFRALVVVLVGAAALVASFVLTPSPDRQRRQRPRASARPVRGYPASCGHPCERRRRAGPRPPV